jgi:hypothetical protein
MALSILPRYILPLTNIFIISILRVWDLQKRFEKRKKQEYWLIDWLIDWSLMYNRK